MFDLILMVGDECSASFESWQPQPGPYRIRGWLGRPTHGSKTRRAALPNIPGRSYQGLYNPCPMLLIG